MNNTNSAPAAAGKQAVTSDVLGQLSSVMLSAETVEQLTRPMLGLLELVTGLESTYLTRVDLAKGVQNVLYARNSGTMQIPEGISVPWEDTLCKRALDENTPYTDDVAGKWGDSQAARALGIQTYASTPIHMADGQLYGTLCAASPARKPLSADGRLMLEMFSTLISRQIEREQLIAQLQEANKALETVSLTDALTGLPNRRRIMGELERMSGLAKRSGQRVLVAFIDLDGFKRINDTYGHEAGDEFLIEVGRRLSAGLRSVDLLGRLGGDEFVIIGLVTAAQDGTPATEATHQRLAPLLKGHYDLSSCAFDYGGASFGIIDADPAATTPDEALRQADAAMYESKKRRKGLH